MIKHSKYEKQQGMSLPGNYMPDWAAKKTLPTGLSTRLRVSTLLRDRIILNYPQKKGKIQELKEVEAGL